MKSGSMNYPKPPTGSTRPASGVWLVGWLAVFLVGCAGRRVEYLDQGMSPTALKAGQPAPSDGWFIPPPLMKKLIPVLDGMFERGELP